MKKIMIFNMLLFIHFNLQAEDYDEIEMQFTPPRKEIILTNADIHYKPVPKTVNEFKKHIESYAGSYEQETLMSYFKDKSIKNGNFFCFFNYDGAQFVTIQKCSFDKSLPCAIRNTMLLKTTSLKLKSDIERITKDLNNYIGPNPSEHTEQVCISGKNVSLCNSFTKSDLPLTIPKVLKIFEKCFSKEGNFNWNQVRKVVEKKVIPKTTNTQTVSNDGLSCNSKTELLKALKNVETKDLINELRIRGYGFQLLGL